MSKSFRKTPKGGHTTAPSEKRDKRLWHGAARARTRTLMAKLLAKGDENVLFPDKKDVSDPWSFSKDGKVYWGAKGTNMTVPLKTGKRTPARRVRPIRRYIFRRGFIVCTDPEEINRSYRK